MELRYSAGWTEQGIVARYQVAGLGYFEDGVRICIDDFRGSRAGLRDTSDRRRAGNLDGPRQPPRLAQQWAPAPVTLSLDPDWRGMGAVDLDVASDGSAVAVWGEERHIWATTWRCD